MARQKPPSKAGAFWRAINVREDLAHGSAQGFVLERSAKRGVKSFAPLWGKPPYGAPKAPVESGGFLARHKCTRRPRARQCAGIRARAKRRALPPCGASLFMARRKGNSATKGVFCRSGRSRYNFTKTKVLKRKRQKIHISKHRIPFCVARHKETKKNLAHDRAQGFVLERSAKRGVKSFAPLRGKPPMARRNEKTRQKKNAIFVSLQKTKVVSKTKVLKRKRQKIHISKHRIPICVARHKETRPKTSRTTERRDSCSSEARSAKAAAGNDERAFVRVLSEKEREARKPRQGMTPLKRCDIIDVWSIAFRTYTDTMSCSAA